jgi:hypothetical protein
MNGDGSPIKRGFLGNNEGTGPLAAVLNYIEKTCQASFLQGMNALLTLEQLSVL